VTNYSRELKGMATTLRDLGEDVTDRTLTLNFIRGLNERFRDVSHLLRRDIPFPQFKDAVNELLLEEMTSAPPSSTPLAVGQAVAPGASQSAQHPKSPRNRGSQSEGAGSGGSSRPRKDDRRKDDRRRKSRPPGNSSSAANGRQTSSKGSSAPSTGGAGGAS
jgi:hypothetical protein